MIFNTFEVVSRTIDTYGKGILDNVNLSNQYNGLFRCPLHKSYEVMPDLDDLFNDAWDMLNNQNRYPEEWEIDVKIHMLMKNQYPCIPNWHCDNVPRVDGKVRYDLTPDHTFNPMYLWVSDEPTTEFLKYNKEMGTVENHADLARKIKLSTPSTIKIPPKTWVKMDQRTPHRGTQAVESGWRVFVRLTHKSMLPQRSVNNSFIRRHSQVYLNPNEFSW